MSLRTERISQFAIIFIAVSALFISIWQGYTSQRHNRLTVRPYFNFTINSNLEEDQFYVSLSNQGYGPAIIKSFELYYDGEKQADWLGVFSKLDSTVQTIQYSSYEENDVFASGKEKTIVTLLGYERSNDIKLVIKFESIYEEAFEIDIEF